jgi:RTX calcium-binding nonapeptide repeat (4 copies)
VRRAVVVLALVFVLALGVVFSTRNAGIAQEAPIPEPYCKPGTQTVGDYYPGAPAPIRDRQVKCWEDVLDPSYDADTQKGSNKPEIVDIMLGRGEKDTLSGRNGRDSLDGGSGNDHLVGGKGSDGLLGGADQDTIIAGDGDDRIFAREDFQGEDPPAQDEISCGGGTDMVSRNVGSEQDRVAEDCEIINWDEPEKKHWWRRLMGR